ncbi:MAG: T9SS type A sorting domain-containing protein [Fluviicola sp.]
MIFSLYNAQCDNQVRTNPTTANNLALPDQTGQVNSPDTRYLNGFNWWNNGGYTLTNMEYNPGQTYTVISNVQDPFNVPYYHYLVEAFGAEEMNPQNGWELLMVNLGRYPDNTTDAPITTLKEIPYIGLYNKFTGILRLFVQYGYNVPPAIAVDGLKINIFYNDGGGTNSNKSTILRLGKGNDKTLDQLNPDPFLTAICPSNGSEVTQWMSADFQLAYDPCVCNFPTIFSVEFWYFSETDFKLSGRSISIDDDLIENGQITNQDFLSGVSADNKNGYIIYEKMQTLADDYIEKMEDYKDQLAIVGEYNEQVDKKLLAIKIFKQVVNIGLLATTGTPGFAQFALAWPDINFKTIVNGQTAIDTAKSEKFYGKVEEILGEYAKTFISESLKKKDNPTKPVMPTVTLTEMQFKGTLLDEDDAPSLLLNTPGSFKNSPTINNPALYDLPQTYPVYNQPVGVFALLETPLLSQSKSSKVSTIACEEMYEQTPLNPNFDSILVTKSFRTTENKSQFKLSNNLAYTFNPGLSYKSKTVSAMYVIKTKVKENNKGVTPYLNENSYYKSKIYDASVNLNSSTINTYNNELIWDYRNASSVEAGGQILKKLDSLVYTSEFIPINAFKNFIVEVATVEYDEEMTPTCSVASGNIVNNFNQDLWENFNIQIKLKVDVEFNGTHSNGDPHIYSYVFTYDVADGNIIPVTTGPFIQNIAGSNSDLLQYPSTLSYQTTTFNGAAVNGCELVGNTYTCQAWNTIEINGNINVTSPYSVNFIAGSEITVSPEAIVSPQSSLSIQQLLDYSNPMPEASSTYVSGFCTGSNSGLPSYKGNVPNKSSNGINTTIYMNESNQYFNWDFNIYPNPTSSNTTVVLSGNNSTNYSVEVSDMTGKVIYSKVNNGEVSSSELELNGISKGVYFVKVNTLQGTKMKQLVIQ